MLTDQNEMLELMKHNIDLNQVENKATASILNWYVFFFSKTWTSYSDTHQSETVLIVTNTKCVFHVLGENRCLKRLSTTSPT